MLLSASSTFPQNLPDLTKFVQGNLMYRAFLYHGAKETSYRERVEV